MDRIEDRAVLSEPLTDRDHCPPSRRVDGKKHSWKFDNDNPIVICEFCGQARDALTGELMDLAGAAARSATPSSKAVPAEDGLREAARALSEAATPGPWIVADPDGAWGAEVASVDGIVIARPEDGSLIEPADPEPDAAFIVAAVNYVRAALASTERATGEPRCSQCGIAIAEHPDNDACEQLERAARSSGELDALVEVVCPRCDGKGAILSGYYDPEETDCLVCDGKGYLAARLREPRQTEGGEG